MRKFAVLTLVIILATSFANAVDLDISPNENGTLDIMVTHSWYWSPGFFSGINFAYFNPLSITEEETLYSALSGTSAELSVDLLGYRFAGDFSAEIALNILYNSNDLKEVGYVDIDTTRLFLVNERKINLLLPRIKGGFSGGNSSFSFRANAEFAPLFPVFFEQVLSVNTGGPREERTTASTAYSSIAWAVTGNFTLRSPAASLLFETGLDRVPLRYTYLDYSLAETDLDSLMVNYSVYAGLALHFIRLGNTSPRVMVGLEKETVTDCANDSILVDDTKLRFKFGLGL